MLDGSSGNSDDKPGVAESYMTSVGTSNLRVGNDHTIRTPGDMVAAAGMNKHRMGLALRRLMHQWDKSAKPSPMAPAAIEAMAAKLKREAATLQASVDMTKEQIAQASAALAIDPDKAKSIRWRARIELPNPHAGLVRVERDGETSYRLPLVAAQQDAAHWHANQLVLLLIGLKSMKIVVADLIFRFPGDGAEHMIARVLLWLLERRCTICKGSGLRVVKGSGGRSGGKACAKCRGTGEQDVPKGGMRIAGYIRTCLSSAQSDLSGGARGERRTVKNQESRDNEAARQEKEKAARVDAEGKDDAVADRQRIAAHFDLSKRRARK